MAIGGGVRTILTALSRTVCPPESPIIPNDSVIGALANGRMVEVCAQTAAATNRHPTETSMKRRVRKDSNFICQTPSVSCEHVSGEEVAKAHPAVARAARF